MELTINRDYRNSGSIAPVYVRYPDQLGPQRAYVGVTEHGTVYVDYSGEIGSGVPADVWHGRTRRYYITPIITIDGIERLLDQLEPLIAEMLDHFEVVWDGANQVGRLDERGIELEGQIEEACNDLGAETEDLVMIYDDPDELVWDWKEAVEEYRAAPDRDTWIREQIDNALANSNIPAMEERNLEERLKEAMERDLEDLLEEEQG